MIIQEPEDVLHEPRAFTVDPRRHARLAQVLTREACDEEPHVGRKRTEFGYVRTEIYPSETTDQYRASRLRNLTQQNRFVSTPCEPNFKTSDSCKKPRDLHDLEPLCPRLSTTHCLVDTIVYTMPSPDKRGD
jgi:hypothetical protein